MRRWFYIDCVSVGSAKDDLIGSTRAWVYITSRNVAAGLAWRTAAASLLFRLERSVHAPRASVYSVHREQEQQLVLEIVYEIDRSFENENPQFEVFIWSPSSTHRERKKSVENAARPSYGGCKQIEICEFHLQEVIYHLLQFPSSATL